MRFLRLANQEDDGTRESLCVANFVITVRSCTRQVCNDEVSRSDSLMRGRGNRGWPGTLVDSDGWKPVSGSSRIYAFATDQVDGAASEWNDEEAMRLEHSAGSRRWNIATTISYGGYRQSIHQPGE